MVARALIGVKKAKEAGEPESLRPRPQPPPAPDEREALRAEAADLGIEVDGRWSAEHLRREIDAAVARCVPRYEDPAESEAEPEAKPQ